MNDIKNIFLAWISASSPVVAAVASDAGLTILSAVILPVLFFAVGKTIDVLLQIHLRKRTTGRNTTGSECALDHDAPLSSVSVRKIQQDEEKP